MGTASTLILATSTARAYASIINDSASTIYLSLGTAAVGSNGIRLNANGGTWETGEGNAIYTGAVYGIASSSANVALTHSQ